MARSLIRLDATLSGVRHRLGVLLRERVAGTDAPERAARIWGAVGPRWFDERDPIWRVHDDAAMFPGGVAALLLQSLHPMAMAGVAGHSGYKSDPWGRLQRTSHYLASTTFGTIAVAEDSINKVRTIHDRVRGKDFRGRPYRASDPQLLRWVHIAEAYSFLMAFQAYARSRLTATEADTYVAQSRLAAVQLGATGLPSTVAELETQLEAYRPDLESTPAAREAARYLVFQPPLPLVARPGYWLLVAGGIAVLPEWARTELGFALPGPLLWLARHLGRFATATVRWAMSSLPPSELPEAEGPESKGSSELQKSETGERTRPRN